MDLPRVSRAALSPSGACDSGNPDTCQLAPVTTFHRGHSNQRLGGAVSHRVQMHGGLPQHCDARRPLVHLGLAAHGGGRRGPVRADADRTCVPADESLRRKKQLAAAPHDSNALHSADAECVSLWRTVMMNLVRIAQTTS